MAQEQLETTVTAGKVEVWRALCLRNGREQFVFDYAPSLGQYVRLVAATEGQPSIRQLKAHRRGSDAGPILQMPEPPPAPAAAPQRRRSAVAIELIRSPDAGGRRPRCRSRGR